jgi:hypothetical protein
MRGLIITVVLIGIIVVVNIIPKKPAYTITQYNFDGTVQQEWAASVAWNTGSCVGFRAGERDSDRYACGTVTMERDQTRDEIPALYTVTLLSDNGTVIRKWGTGGVSRSSGCLSFNPAGPAGEVRACGNVIAEPVNAVPSGEVAARYKVTLLSSTGDTLRSWDVRHYDMSSGAIYFFLEGDRSNGRFYATGNLQVVPR